MIIEKKYGQLDSIDDLHPSYLALQYSLLFSYGEDGFRTCILHSEELLGKSTADKPHNKLTMREWMTFRMQGTNRGRESSTL